MPSQCLDSNRLNGICIKPVAVQALARRNVARYLVGGVTVRVRAYRPCFGGLVRGMSAFKWECGVLLLGPLARLMGLRPSETFRCLYAPHFRDFQPPRQSAAPSPPSPLHSLSRHTPEVQFQPPVCVWRGYGGDAEGLGWAPEPRNQPFRGKRAHQRPPGRWLNRWGMPAAAR
jgi:hypothetical protein